YTFDVRTGNYTAADGSTLGGPQGAPGTPANPGQNGQQYVDETTTLATRMAAAGIPDEQIVAFITRLLNPGNCGFPSVWTCGPAAPAPASAAQTQAPASPHGGALPPRLDYQGGGHVNPFASRRPEDDAYATEAAKQQAQLAYLPTRQAVETQGA